MRPSLSAGVNEPADPHNLSDLEKKHLPTIEAPEAVQPGEWFDATVAVGKMLAHPNEPGHSIEFLELYSDDLFLARVDLTGARIAPRATLRVNLAMPAGELRAYARCNIHGVWVGRKPISVAGPADAARRS